METTSTTKKIQWIVGSLIAVAIVLGVLAATVGESNTKSCTTTSPSSVEAW